MCDCCIFSEFWNNPLIVFICVIINGNVVLQELFARGFVYGVGQWRSEDGLVCDVCLRGG